MRYRKCLDTYHHNTAACIDHIDHPHYAPTADNYCRTTSPHHNHHTRPATSCGRACPTYSCSTRPSRG
ncbi:hypothetical protein [Nocardia abscessus]|uniref:hypothetical protein n=1 Tax=Nocardia abscessus TaxID=120957 RepID=UPI002455B80C|nr:hypothetical protein [Nocardia abscessus]